MSHRYPNGSFAECSSRRRAWQRSRNLTNAWILGILRGDKEKRNRSHRKSNCKNFSLGKLKNKLSFYFIFSSGIFFFILRDTSAGIHGFLCEAAPECIVCFVGRRSVRLDCSTRPQFFNFDLNLWQNYKSYTILVGFNEFRGLQLIH